MYLYLKEQIENRIADKNLSVYALEKKAGLSRSSIRNILKGLSKKPSGEVLIAIAEALDCTAEDLAGPGYTRSNIISSSVKLSTKTRNSHQWNEKLYIESVKSVCSFLPETNLNLKSDQIIALINEIYKYSLEKTPIQSIKILPNGW